MTASVVDFATLAPLATGNGAGRRRFAWVTAGHRAGPDRIFDCDLGNAEHAAVVPTVGAIIPEWLLVVPRVEALSAAELPVRSRHDVLRVAHQVAGRVREVAGASVVFEHGAGRAGSLGGCGVDQAHLHVVGLGGDFVQSVLGGGSASLTWTPADPQDPWSAIPKGADYLLIMQDGRAWTALTQDPVSQFMRRRIASFVGFPGEWDYRRYPHADNAERTKSIFQSIQAH